MRKIYWKYLLNPPKRIIKVTYNNGNSLYGCQKCNIFNKWVDMTHTILFDDGMSSMKFGAYFRTLTEAQKFIGIDTNPIVEQEVIIEL